MNENTSSHLTRDIFGISAIGFTLYTLMALVTFSPKDPSFNKFSSGVEKVNNMGGKIGAFLSDLLVQSLGTGAFIFPLVTLLVGWALIRGREFYRWPVALGFGSLFLIAFCALLAIQYKDDLFFGIAAQSGGLLGKWVANWLVLWLNPVGTQLLLVTLIFISMFAMFGVPISTLIDITGNFIKRTVRFVFRSLIQGLQWGLEVVKGFKSWMIESWNIWKTTNKGKVKKHKLSEPVIISNELMTPVPKKFDLPEKKSKEKKDKADFAIQEDFPFMKDSENYQVPPLDLLNDPSKIRNVEKLKQEIILNSTILEKKLLDFGIEGRVVQVLPGPVITLYEFEPAPGIKVSRIMSLTDDLSLAMRAPSVRILAPVPGKPVVGIELPNPKRETVFLKEILSSEDFQDAHSKLALAVGKDNIGQPIVQDLAQVPHLLLAGSTGSGKSVGINSMICSLLLNASPDEVKMIMIDPKMLELSMYDGIPHLISPVVTNPKKAAAALQWAVSEMERRYKLMAELAVRNISGYNNRIEKLQSEHDIESRKQSKLKKPSPSTSEFLDDDFEAENISEEDKRPSKLPYIVIIIDELADLMMVSSRGVEESLTRLAQMARAAGIHLIVATQRPSVDVLTGIIKANFPARISYQVTSRVDSRTILDSMGAEKLLGKGDMLFLPPGTSRLQRIHGALVSDEEINRILKFIKEQGSGPEFSEDVFQVVADQKDQEEGDEEYDEKYDEAVALVAREQQASISMVQRKLRVGYNRAARMIEIMEREGVVGRSDGIKPREVFVKPISMD